MEIYDSDDMKETLPLNFLSTCMFISVLGDNFMKYMEAFKPCLIVSLKNSEEYTVS